jgi:hypothetical protein
MHIPFKLPITLPLAFSLHPCLALRQWLCTNIDERITSAATKILL